MKKPPCEKDCPRREPGCHARCQSYISWSEIHEKEKEERRKDGVEVRAYFKARDARYYKEQRHHNKGSKAKYHGK